MPQLMLPIPEVTDQVTRPIVLDIVRQIVTATRLDENAKILFPGDEEHTPLTGSTISKDGKEIATFPHENQIKIEINETIESDNVLTRAVLKEEHLPIFRDSKLDILMKPVYAHTKTEIQFNIRFTDRATAKRWINEAKNKISLGRLYPLHEVTYSYTIPLPYIALLQEIHRLRENVAPYNEDFDTYFNKHKTPNVTELTNVGGKVVRKGVRETQQRILGMFDFVEEPERGSKDEADAWLIGFTYTIQYEKPSAVVLQYPIVVHNQLLDTKYRPDRRDAPTPKPYDVKRSYASSIKYMSIFETDSLYFNWIQNRGIAVPDFDEWLPSSVVEGTYRMVTYLIGLTEQDRIDLVNIKELPETSGLDKDLESFLIHSELPFVNRPTESVFQVSLYEDFDMLDSSSIYIDSDYNIKATSNLDLRKQYHVRISVYWDWTKLSDAALDRLRRHPLVVKKLVGYLYPWYTYYYSNEYDPTRRHPNHPVFDLVNNGSWLSRKDLDTIIDGTLGKTDRDRTNKATEDRYLRTVQEQYAHVVRKTNSEYPTAILVRKDPLNKL